MTVRRIGGSKIRTAVADFGEILEFEICAASVLSAFARNGLYHHFFATYDARISYRPNDFE
jgi:hypothetical protein